MEDSHFNRLNTLLRQASERHSIAKYGDCRSWFQGPEESVEEKAAELDFLFSEGVRNKLINTWTEPGDSNQAIYWNWSVTALEKAKVLNITLADPLGGTPLFEHVSNRITAPNETIQSISIDLLDDDVCGHLNRVFQEQVRYVVIYRGKPVAAIIPLADLELLKVVKVQVDPGKWIDWVQNIRERLGWPAITFNEEEK